MAFDRIEAVAVRIGERSPAFDRLLIRHGARIGVFITAWNPRSRPRSRGANDAATRRLARRVAGLGYRSLPQAGCPDAGDWPPEQCLLVFDLAVEAALKLARAFGQYAVVRAGRGSAPRLLFSALPSASRNAL